MAPFGVDKYPQIVRELLTPPRLAPLGTGSPDRAVRPKLAALRAADLSVGKRPADLGMAAACLAGLWLYFDFLDESHQLSQENETTTGSYWHAIMHRREGDFGNAKYWFRRVGDHPVMPSLLVAARGVAVDGDRPGLRELLSASIWDPYRFVDLCAAATRGEAGLDEPCRLIQRLEWELLFDFCFDAAVGET